MSAVAAIHPRYATPARAIAIQAILASILILVGTFNSIIAYFIFVVVLFIALTVVDLFVLRRTDSETVFKTPGYPLTPLIFLFLIGLMLFLLAAHNLLQAFFGVTVVALGLPVYYMLFRKRRSNS